MFCNNCGIELPQDAVFCRGCGKKVGEQQADSSPRKKSGVPKLVLAAILIVAVIAVAAVLVILFVLPKKFDGYIYEVEGDTITIINYEGELDEIEIPSEIKDKPVTAIAAEFKGENLISVIIPDSVTSIERTAFAGSSVQNLTLSENLTTVSGFGNCKDLKSVVIPEGVEIIEQAFNGCSSLETVVLPDSLTTISNSFSKCDFTEIEIPDDVSKIFISFNNCNNLIDITLPQNVVLLELAFLNCLSLSEVTIPDSISEISSSFAFCARLESVRFLGNAPRITVSNFHLETEEGKTEFTGFSDCSENLLFYYPSEAEGWTTPLWNGFRAMPDTVNVEPESSIEIESEQQEIEEKQPEIDNKIYTAYFDVLTEMSLVYGVRSDYDVSGLVSATMIDVTGDGIDELVVYLQSSGLYESNSKSGYIIYGYDALTKTARFMCDKTEMLIPDSVGLRLFKGADNNNYIRFESGQSGELTGEYCTYRNGAWITVLEWSSWHDWWETNEITYELNGGERIDEAAARKELDKYEKELIHEFTTYFSYESGKYNVIDEALENLARLSGERAYVPAENFNTNASDMYVLHTNTQYITESDLWGLSEWEVRVARNEIYARHGYTFKDSALREYFEAKSWYTAQEDVNASTFDAAVLNVYEKANLEFILKYERDMGWQ